MKMNPLLFSLLLLFLCFFLSKSELPIPSKIDGFVYRMPSVWGESVVVEAFLDPVCPDSRDSWPPLKQALDYYSGRLSLVVHPFPLPYHSNAFIACRSLHIANKLNSSSVYPLLELFFKTQEKYYNAPTYGMSRASIVADMTKLALTAIGESFGTAFLLGFNDSSTDQAARISFKAGCASERSKRLREDSMLLLKGLDSVSSTLSQLSDTLNSAQKGADALANSIQAEEPRAKRYRTSPELTEKTTLKDTGAPSDNSSDEKEEKLISDGDAKSSNLKTQVPSGNLSDEKEENIISDGAAKSSNLKTARMLAVSMATKAASLSKELKNIKSELNFMQERCNHLEEENRRLREEDYDRGASHDDEDLLRLQLEALLAEKSRLAQENADLTRENRSLHQLVEYHQLTSQDLTASFEAIEGLYLDFSSTVEEENGDGEEENPNNPN